MKKKLKFTLAILLVLACSLCTFSLAAAGTSSGNVTLTPSATELNSGDTFTVVISQECSDGIIGFESDLNYDTNVFELTKTTLDSQWSSLVEGNALDAMTTASNDITSGDIFTLTFKVKENVSPVTSEIKLTGIKLHKTSNASDIIQISDKAISIDVNGGGVVESTTLSRIEITTKPSKTIYTEGEKFSTEGMVITAVYSDGTTKEITDYTYSPKSELETENKLVTISYTEAGVTKTTTQNITVNTTNSNGGNNNDNNSNNTNNNNDNSNNNSNTSLQGITLSNSTLTLSLELNSKMKLIAYAKPTTADLPEIIWSSSNEKVAKLENVDSKGSATVVPVAVGTATITAKTADGKYSATCKVTVNKNGNVSGTNTTNNSSNTANKTTNTNNKTNSTTDNTATVSSLPKTGSTTKYILLIVAGLIGIAFVSYKGYEKYKSI